MQPARSCSICGGRISFPKVGRMTENNRILLIGAGHNGLVCAAYLAKAGRDVLVLEASERVGGAAITREFAPGFRVSACAHLSYLLDASISRELRLSDHGLKPARANLRTVALAAGGDPLILNGGVAEGNSLSAKDREALAS